MTARHFITNGNFTFLCNVAANYFIYTRTEFVLAVFSCKYFYIYNNTVLAVRNTQGRITYFTGFFTKDGTQQSFFRSQLCFSFWSYFTNQNIAGTHFSTYTDNTGFIQIAEQVFVYVWNISGNFFRTKFGISCFNFIFFNMNGGINVVANDFFID